jgi:hypothetical protein
MPDISSNDFFLFGLLRAQTLDMMDWHGACPPQVEVGLPFRFV